MIPEAACKTHTVAAASASPPPFFQIGRLFLVYCQERPLIVKSACCPLNFTTVISCVLLFTNTSHQKWKYSCVVYVPYNAGVFLPSLIVSLLCLFAATAPSTAPVPAAGPGAACGPAAPGSDPSYVARRLLQLGPAVPLLHPGQLLPRPGPGGKRGQGPGLG